MENIQKLVDQVNRYMASRQPLDTKALYNWLEAQYPGVFSLEDGSAYHSDVLHGSSSAGTFEVYDNWLDIIFDVVKPDGSCTHWHPADMDEVIADIEAFMQGHSKY